MLHGQGQVWEMTDLFASACCRRRRRTGEDVWRDICKQFCSQSGGALISILSISAGRQHAILFLRITLILFFRITLQVMQLPP